MREGGRGGAIEAEHAHLRVDRHRRLAENLGEPAGAVAALQLHLEQPVLRMGEAEPEGEVVVVLGGDRRYAVGVAGDR